MFFTFNRRNLNQSHQTITVLHMQVWRARGRMCSASPCSSVPLSPWLSGLVQVEPSGERRQAEAVCSAHLHCLPAKPSGSNLTTLPLGGLGRPRQIPPGTVEAGGTERRKLHPPTCTSGTSLPSDCYQSDGVMKVWAGVWWKQCRLCCRKQLL